MSRRPMLAMLALSEAAMPSAGQLVRILEERWPEIPAAAEPTERPGVVTLTMGQDRAGMALLPRPLPWADLEGPCEVARHWPGAAEAFRSHSAHLAATVLGSDPDCVASALGLTALAAATTVVAPAVGIYWGPGRLVHEPRAFLDESTGMSRQNLPLHLWIDFRMEAAADGTHSLFTTGMEAFGQMELEIACSRREPRFLHDCAYNIAHYLLVKGVQLKQGETIGLTEEEQIPITIGPSMWDERMMVIRLET
jgi:hypothetical protein